MTEAIGAYVGDAAAKGASVSFTRTADTNSYTANDVIGSATGSTAAMAFLIGPGVGGEVMITSAYLEIDETAAVSGEAGYNLALYSVTPPSAYGDNAAWDLPSGDRASYLDTISLGQPVDVGSTCIIKTDGINKQITVPVGGYVYGYLITLGGFTPASATPFKVGLHAIPV